MANPSDSSLLLDSFQDADHDKKEDTVDEDWSESGIPALTIKTDQVTTLPQSTQGGQWWAQLTEGVSYMMKVARSKLSSSSSASDFVRFLKYPMANFPQPSGDRVMFLGKEYPSFMDAEFMDDFHSRLWMTYRKGFPPIKPSSFTSDGGWGCMHRSGQMLLANALLYHKLGRDWRLAHLDSNRDIWLNYSSLLSLFLDSNTSPFSIHKISLQGKALEKNVGEWFGPSTVSQVLKMLVNTDTKTNLRVHVANDGALYRNNVHKEFNAPADNSITGTSFINDDTTSESCGLLILIPLRLGVETLNPAYFDALKKCFHCSQLVGIAGGRPNSSLFFVGYDKDQVIYLDPHTMQGCVPVRDISSYEFEDLISYHCASPRLLSLHSVDPSMVLGFYCKDVDAFHSLCSELESTVLNDKTPLFTLENEKPTFMTDAADIISDDEF